MTPTSYYRSHADQLVAACRWWRYWLHLRPLLAGSLSVVAVSWLLILITTAPAYAADAAASVGELTDTNGISIAAYAELPVGEGGLLDASGQANHWFLSGLWSAVHKNAVGLLGAFAFVFSFEWVLWLATPFQAVSFLIGQLFGSGAGVLALLTVTAVVGGAVALSGKVAAGFTEIFLAVVASVLLAGALQNPTQWLVGENGALTTVSGWARELASVTATGESGSTAALDTSVTMPLVDIAVRMPFHHTSFGQELTGECARVLERALVAGDDGQAIRDQVRGCNPEAADYGDAATMDMVTSLLLSSLGRLGAMLPLGLGLLTVTITLVFVLFDSVKLLLGLYVALLPFNKQMAWQAGLGMLMGLLSMLLQVVLIVAWGKAVVELIRLGTEVLSYEVMQYTLSGVFFALASLLVVVAWQMRQRAKSLASKASQLGSSMQPVKALPVAAAAGIAWKAADAAIKLATHKRMGELGKNRPPEFIPVPVFPPAGGAVASQVPPSRRHAAPSPRPAAGNFSPAGARPHGFASRRPIAGPNPPEAGTAMSPSPVPPMTPSGGGMQEGRFERSTRPARRAASAGQVVAGAARVAIVGALSGGAGAVSQGVVELGDAAAGVAAQRARRVMPDPKTGVASITALPSRPVALPPARPQPRAIAQTAAQRQLQRRLQEARG